MNTLDQGFIGTNYHDRLRQIMYPHLPVQPTNMDAEYSASIPVFIQNLSDDNPFIKIVSFNDPVIEKVEETSIYGEDSEEAQAFLEKSDELSGELAKVLVSYGIRKFALTTGFDTALDEISKALPAELSYAEDFKVAMPKVEKALLMETAEQLATVLKCQSKLNLTPQQSDAQGTLVNFLTEYAKKTGKPKSGD